MTRTDSVLGKALQIIASIPLYAWLVALALLVVVFGWLAVREYRSRKAISTGKPEPLAEIPLVGIWKRFLAGLPAAARPLVGRYPWVVVIGDSGTGKTTLIDAKADWQSQSNNKFPSYTQEPHLKLYLGRRAVVHELSPQLIADPRKVVTDALSALWRPLCRVRPPLAVIVLSLEQLGRAAPQQLRTQAQRLAGTLSQLSALCGTPILTRVCLTQLEPLSGHATIPATQPGNKASRSGIDSLAESLARQRVPLVLNLHTFHEATADRSTAADRPSIVPFEIGQGAVEPGPLARQFLQFSSYLKYGLPRLPSGGFDDIVRCLASAPESLRPLEVLVSELVMSSKSEAAALSTTLQLEKLYLMPHNADLQGKNPLVLAGTHAPRLTRGMQRSGLFGLWATLRNSHVLSTWHAKLCAGLVLLSLLLNGALYSNQSQQLALLDQLDKATQELVVAVDLSKGNTGLPAESGVVGWAAEQAGDRLNSVLAVKEFWPFSTRAFLRRKKTACPAFLSAVQKAYFDPQISNKDERGNDPAATAAEVAEAMAPVVYSLAAIHATKDGILNKLLKKKSSQVAAALQMSERTLADYLNCTNADPASYHHEPRGRLQAVVREDPWKEFLRDIQKAMESRSGPAAIAQASVLDLPKLQKEASTLADELELFERTSELRNLAAAIQDECGRVEELHSVERHRWTLVPSEWLEQNLRSFRGVTQLVLSSSLELPPNHELDQATLEELLQSLTPNPKAPGTKDRVYTAHFRDGTTLSIRESQWLDALAASRRKLLKDQLRNRLRSGDPQQRLSAPRGMGDSLEKGGARPPLVTSPLPRCAGYPVNAVGPSSDGSPRVSKGLPDPYNKAAFERTEKPARLAADQTLTAAALPPADQVRIVARLLDAAQGYACRYAQTLRAHFVSYGVQAETRAALRAAVGELLLPDSSLSTRLRQVADNANLGDLPGPYLQPMVDNLAPLRPLIKLATIKDGGYPELDPYRAMLTQLAAALDAPPAAVGGPTSPLPDSLSGLGRLALGILAEKEDSPLLLTQRWLDKAGIAPELRGPFLAPLRRALLLGTAEVEKAIADRWQTIYKAQVQPLYTRFPFDRAAQSDVALSALDVIAPSKGSLWRFVREDLAGLVDLAPDGTITAKRQPGGSLTLPADLVPTLTQLGRLSRQLWEGKEDTRRPLELRVRPEPPVGSVGGYSITRAYLSVGSVAAVSFNQMPAEVAMQVPWWNQENAAVGVELSTPDSKVQNNASLSPETRSVWSLWRLLTRGKMADTRLTFSIPVTLHNLNTHIEVGFVFSADPFALFQPPTVLPKRR